MTPPTSTAEKACRDQGLSRRVRVLAISIWFHTDSTAHHFGTIILAPRKKETGWRSRCSAVEPTRSEAEMEIRVERRQEMPVYLRLTG
jgi:hypothetical protein